MPKISRARRAELTRHAYALRQRGQRAGHDVARIAATIIAELPQLHLLEGWRLAYGWSRPQVINGLAALYADDGLAAPPITSSMLCRWEHGTCPPSVDYAHALCRLYGASPAQLGLSTHAITLLASSSTPVCSASSHPRPLRRHNGAAMADNDGEAAALSALRESLQLALEVDGPAGGPDSRVQLEHAVAYYAQHYSRFPPRVLAGEIHRTRTLVTAMLNHPQPGPARRELRRLAGWLSALLGNLAFHCGDYPAAGIHLATAARLGTDVGQAQLTSWSLGAHSMLAHHQHRYTDALDLARQAYEIADTPLRRAQTLAWTELRTLAALGRRNDAVRIATAAQDAMAADPHGEQKGRFGFDTAELHLHLAESHLALGEHTATCDHAEQSQRATTVARPGWAGATLTYARGQAADGNGSDAAALGLTVLDTVAPEQLRHTSRQRLADLNNELAALGAADRETRELHQRLLALPPLVPAPRASNEPDGH